ncbi:MAG: hypothetical protein QJR02_11525 [Sinobacteraceae bacterium]|nr:hypothetical protein [Nevskiaceae bacterium]
MTLPNKTYHATAYLDHGTFHNLDEAGRQQAMTQIADVLNYMLSRCGPRTTELRARLEGPRLCVTITEHITLVQWAARLWWLPSQFSRKSAGKDQRHPLALPLEGDFAPQQMLDMAVNVTNTARARKQDPLASFAKFMESRKQ